MQSTLPIYAESQKPTPYEYVIAKTQQARYISYVDADGSWFRAADHSIIYDVLHWYPLGVNSRSAEN